LADFSRAKMSHLYQTDSFFSQTSRAFTLNKKPWMLDPTLDASSEDGRLLGIDL